MKTLILSCVATVALLSLSACKTSYVTPREPAVHSTTTTTEQSTPRHPFGTTMETQTTRTY